ncbi:MAG: cytochrome ubiquinol oxidase subunit I [Eggerthellales bacterium]|nr:cytochrome ubiquinol oxidase subunit I [Eggerthellales bacterium]
MELLQDVVFLDRLQFAATAIYHYMFVPLSIGFGLILAILMTKAYRSGKPEDDHLARFWLKLFTGTFAVGVATGITMEFSFGTNWADYSRFVGDIFGAPLAAEALFAFFLESVFLGVLLFGREKVSKKFYLVSGWLVWFGSCLSALWIIIANSWMQTPAGFAIGADGNAVLTDFFAAALNYSTLQRYAHVLVAVMFCGALMAIAVGAYYLLKKRAGDAGMKLVRLGAIVTLVCAVLMVPAGHQQAVEVAEQQPAKLAAMEGMYESGPVGLSVIGWVDEANQKLITIEIPGLTSFLATGDFNAEFPGLNDFPESERPTDVNLIYQCYHFMLIFFGVAAIALILALLVSFGKLDVSKRKWPLYLMMVGWAGALLAIQFGWCTAEFGRQPWIVYGQLLTADGVSAVVDAPQVIITLVLFAVVYTFIYVVWARSFIKTVKEGPEAIAAADEAAAHPVKLDVEVQE